MGNKISGYIGHIRYNAQFNLLSNTFIVFAWATSKSIHFLFVLTGLSLSFFISTKRSREFVSSEQYSSSFFRPFFSAERSCGFHLPKVYSFPFCIETRVFYPLLFATSLIKHSAGLTRESLVKADVNFSKF